ncbi:glutamine-tRNA ligase [Allomyces macrogynus ATCC 38327]|uniref:glutamine--tRNA ligase n=1 Tax=Allomyces macrogynus (strain ATCC 38327) TaxID=578462 RepID=A0A0L0RXF6_ALLM3|nr:glutamine-tRNA ligase [Allomyces macrogynus ATCC 38327]|eukprot:KNE54835.1 glutamine-tRNA ligase [Allomyces macrogynus ATCC 38327]
MENLETLFLNIGLTEVKARETAGNKKLAPTLKEILDHAAITEKSDVPKATGSLLYNLASTITKNGLPHLAFLTKEITGERLKSNDQVAASVKFFDKVAGGAFDQAKYEEECGVGIEVSDKEVKQQIADLFKANKAKIEADRYRSLGFLLGQARNSRLRWANAVTVKNEIDAQLLATLGPKDERDDPKLLKKKAKEAAPAKKDAAAAAKPAEEKLDAEAMLVKMMTEGEITHLHKPGENPQPNPQRMVEHLKATGGKVVTRFPPEPNGFLHIGHAKAINIDFGYAQVHNGVCYLRYDDTNPDAEEKRYFDTIIETVRWLGFEPWKITYSSDYFDVLYELAVKLIKIDKAYVCHCTGEEIYEQRGGDSKGERFECKHRNRPIAESLAEFEKMKQGRYAEGEAILRMKMDMTSGNPQFWDLAAYRIKYTPHYRTADKWCIYPTYDYTHCLVDSLENITHSLCTLEFRQSRESYYWLVDALDLYKPVQWETGRLNINHTVMSKRKLNKLVSMGTVRGWDDPRLYTIVALRRRGFPAAAINMFVRSSGVTTSNSVTEVSRLDSYVRTVLNETVPRLMAILDPIKITISNLPDAHCEMISLPNNPLDPSAGTHKVPFTRTVFIERDDFRTEDAKDFKRLAPGKPVGLQSVPFPISYVSHKTDANGNVTEILAKYENDPKKPATKPKAFIHWVAHAPKLGSPVAFEARNYDRLFQHAFPENKDEVPGGWLSDINPNSLSVSQGLLEVGIVDYVRKNAKRMKELNVPYSSAADNEGPHREASDAQLRSVEDLKFQFTRVGYFCVDPDSRLAGNEPSKWHLVINKTIGLKEDSGKSK